MMKVLIPVGTLIRRRRNAPGFYATWENYVTTKEVIYTSKDLIRKHTGHDEKTSFFYFSVPDSMYDQITVCDARVVWLEK